MQKKNKFLIIVGARPNFVKIAPLYTEFKKYKEIKLVLVHTGQHYDFVMSKIFFKELNIPKPDYNLEIGSGSHAYQTAEIMKRLEKVVLKEKPNLVIVIGDVNSTLAGALVAAKLKIPLAHIEAGMRTFDKKEPEEINRVLTDQISDFLLCPTRTGTFNLKKEGIKESVYNVGDLMYDTFLKWKSKIQNPKSKLLKKLNLKPKSYILLTLHRPANVDNLENLEKVLRAVQESGENIIFPSHPRTKKQLKKLKLKIENCKLRIIEPVSYFDMLCLEKNAAKIITDSGGVQKEAYWSKVPCITLLDKTPWTETVQTGWNILAGNNSRKIILAVKRFSPKKKQKNFFGEGQASQKIVQILINRLWSKKN